MFEQISQGIIKSVGSHTNIKTLDLKGSTLVFDLLDNDHARIADLIQANGIHQVNFTVNGMEIVLED